MTQIALRQLRERFNAKHGKSCSRDVENVRRMSRPVTINLPREVATDLCHGNMSESIEVRPFQSMDREEVFRIASDTAFFGEPVEAYLDDRRMFCDAFYRYYTDIEPEHALVACLDSQVMGYLTGCVDTTTQRRQLATKILPSVAWRALLGYYSLGRKTWRYIRSMVVAGIRQEFPHVDLHEFPAHLHINLDSEARGRGLGRRLMDAHLDQLRKLRVPGVFLNTTSMNEAACSLYEKIGFELFDARPTQIWSHLIDQPVENRSYGLKLVGEA